MLFLTEELKIVKEMREETGEDPRSLKTKAWYEVIMKKKDIDEKRK